MMKNFSSLNEKLKESRLPPSSSLMESLIQVATARRTKVQSVSENYARQYVMVQELTVNSDGNIQDQTDAARQSVATNALRTVQLQLKADQERMDSLRDQINAVEPVDSAVSAKFKVPKAIKLWVTPTFRAEISGRNYVIVSDVATTKVVTHHDDIALINMRNHKTMLMGAQDDDLWGKTIKEGVYNHYLRSEVEAQIPSSRIAVSIQLAANFQMMQGPDPKCPLDQATFLVYHVVTKDEPSETDLRPTVTTVKIPSGAVSKDILELFVAKPVLITDKYDSTGGVRIMVGVGWKLVLKEGVSQDDLASIVGAQEFYETKGNKLFCGTISYIRSSDGILMTASTADLSAYNDFTTVKPSDFFANISEEPFAMNMSEVASKQTNYIKATMTSPTLQAAYADFKTTIDSYTFLMDKFAFAMLFTRSYPIMFSPNLIAEGSDNADAIRASAFSPYTTMVLGCARQLRIKKSNEIDWTTSQYLLQPFGNTVQDEMYERGYTGQIDIFYSSTDESYNLIPQLNANNNTATSMDVKGAPQIADIIAPALLYSNQDELESLIMSL